MDPFHSFYRALSVSKKLPVPRLPNCCPLLSRCGLLPGAALGRGCRGYRFPASGFRRMTLGSRERVTGRLSGGCDGNGTFALPYQGPFVLQVLGAVPADAFGRLLLLLRRGYCGAPPADGRPARCRCLFTDARRCVPVRRAGAGVRNSLLRGSRRRCSRTSRGATTTGRSGCVRGGTIATS